MKSKDKHLVPIPDDKGVHIKSAGAKGEKYVCNYIKFFRNSEGAPEASRFFSSITHEEKIVFFRLWVKRHYGGKSVCYDMPSVSSCIKPARSGTWL